MKMNNFDKELEQALCEYVQNTEVTTNEKITFSKKHKKKMEKLFEDVRNSNFEKGNIDETKRNSYHFNVRIFARVAVFIILGLLITIAVMPSMVAWRTDKLGMYGDETDEYAWFLLNDITSILKNDGDGMKIEDLTFFEYLPKGSVVKEKVTMRNCYYIKINVDSEEFVFKVLLSSNRAIDTENIELKRIMINENETFLLEKDDVCSFVWYFDGKNYNLFGTLRKNEMIKIIENINYEEIDKIL
ncbi:MAG: DUF4367 domain-containing protein [Clostridia bacterium]|nr:DUF4367 domain-containing protein [Clostridia bacterium]